MNLRSTVIFTLFFSIFVFIFSFSIEENKTNLKSSNYCNQLTYKESLNIHPNKFSSISIEVVLSLKEIGGEVFFLVL